MGGSRLERNLERNDKPICFECQNTDGNYDETTSYFDGWNFSRTFHCPDCKAISRVAFNDGVPTEAVIIARGDVNVTS